MSLPPETSICKTDGAQRLRLGLLNGIFARLRQDKNPRRSRWAPPPFSGDVLGGHARGFTLIEVLATMLLMAIVLPAVMQGIALSTRAATVARHRTEAAGLAQSKMNEILVTNAWQQGVTAGDFGPDWPDYHWQLAIAAWAPDTSSASMQELDLTVTWNANGQTQSVKTSTLAYVKPQSTSTS